MSNTVLNQLRVLAIVKSRAFKRLFLDELGRPARGDAERVLGDLAKFSFAKASTFDPDPYVAARRAGRRDVWLRLNGFLNLDEDQVQKAMEIDDGE